MTPWLVMKIWLELVLFCGFAVFILGLNDTKKGLRSLRPLHFVSWRGGLPKASYLIGGLILFYVHLFLVQCIIRNNYGIPYFFDYRQMTAYPEIRYLSIVFVYGGAVLMMKRLRTLQLPVWLAVLSAIPVVNFLSMVLFSIIPEVHDHTPDSTNPRRSKRSLSSLIPRSGRDSSIMAIWLTAMQGYAAIFLGTEIFQTYGSILFIAGPFMLGWLAVGFYTYHERKSLINCIKIACLSLFILSLMIVMFALDGAICVAMALPLAIPLAIFGAVIGYFNQTFGPDPKKIIPFVILAMPLMMGAEFAARPVAQVLPVTTSVVIDASIETVWKNVIAFPPLPQPHSALFFSGVAYPQYASITGTGVGAVRECHFSTGPFIEPITVWEENKLLRFDVTRQPAPMKELSPYSDIHPPHLDNYLLSKQGQFLLRPLPNGKVKLEGTTWYSIKMWPEAYWRLWSDDIIHEIHSQVLEHIKNISEKRRS